MATNSFWIGYHFEEFRSQVAIKKKNSRPVSVLRECWEADFCYLVRVEARGRTISTQGGVEGGYRGKCYCLKEFLLDHTNFFERFFWMTIFCQNFWAGLFFFHANAKRPSKHCTSIVSKNMANSRFLILHCSVSHACTFKLTCSDAKWHSPLITNPLSVASRFPLCGQYIITKFIYHPLVID